MVSVVYYVKKFSVFQIVLRFRGGVRRKEDKNLLLD